MAQEDGSSELVGETSRQRWYVVQAYSGFESQAMSTLKERIARSGLQDMFGDVLVPTEEVVEMRDGRKRKSERKFFPGYVLIKMEMNDKTWHLVHGAPKILGFIGDNKKDGRTNASGSVQEIASISDAEANSILQRVEEGVDSPKPKVLFEAGEVVRIKDGPFTDFNGVVEEVNVAKNRLQVSVLIFGRSTPVELEFGQVEKE